MSARQTVLIRTLNDLDDSLEWTILVDVVNTCELRYISSLKTQIFNFDVADASGTVCSVEVWNTLALVVSKTVKLGSKYYISKGQIKEDTFTHKYRQSNYDYRIRLKEGSEVSRFDVDPLLLEYITTVKHLKRIITEIKSKSDQLENIRYCFSAKITKVSYGNALYKTCRGASCANKDRYPFERNALCSVCTSQSDECGWTYRIVLHLEDDDSLIKVTIHSYQAEKFFTKHPEEAHELRTNKVQYDAIFSAAVGKEAVFRVRPHMFNGNIEFTVCDFYA